MEENKENQKFDPSKSGVNWRPVLLFYARTTGWIVIPLILALVLGNLVAPGLLFLFMILGFILTCVGIYRELKSYKKSLDKMDKTKTNL
jgi:hypothetical protein